MKIERERFCVNRKIAPSLTIEEFFKVVKKCGLNKVEIRNDMPSGKILDDLTPSQFNELAHQYGIEVVTINAIYPFNLPSSRKSVEQRAREMLDIAQNINVGAIIMCPFNEVDTRSEQEKINDTVDSIKYFSDIFAQYGIGGLIEPLGFPISSLRSFKLAGQILKETNTPFKMTFDTFHTYLSGLSITDFKLDIDINQIGLVHLSGVEDARAREELTDEERIMLSKNDVLKSKEQVIELERLGYKGIYSFEPFSSILSSWTAKDIESAINSSITYICD